jgi:thiamine kinase-like enzyme
MATDLDRIGAEMAVQIDEVIASIADWRDKSVAAQRIAGGLTNTNFLVDVNGERYFVRIPGAQTELLAVDRKNEHFNTVAAAQAGVGPRVCYFLPEHQVMVLEFIAGKTMSNQALNEPGMPARVAHSIKLLHRGPRFYSDFNMFRLTEYYLGIVQQHGFAIPEGYLSYMPAVNRIEAAMSVAPLPTVPCNNDLLAENYIDDGKILRLIDYEYSGNNDPCFELGNTCQELMYDETRLRELCAAYFGKASAAMIARMKLNMIMSDVGWGLWAAIQARISQIDYDFWGWAVERWSRAKEKMDSDEFETWLVDVQSDD